MHVTQVRVPYKCTSKIVYTAYNAIYASYCYIQTAQTVLIFTAIFWNHQLFLWPQIANNVVADSLAETSCLYKSSNEAIAVMHLCHTSVYAALLTFR